MLETIARQEHEGLKHAEEEGLEAMKGRLVVEIDN